MTDYPIIPHADLPIEPLDEAGIQRRAPDWYETWRDRIRHWLTAHADDDFAEVLLLVPDMLALVVRLTRDKRVPFRLKGQLLLAIAYVLSPFDLVPEALLGVIGLTDDAGVLALVLMGIQAVASLDQQVLRDNWSGRGDVIDTIEQTYNQINQNADKLFTDKTWKRIRKAFGKGGRRRLSLPRRRQAEN